MTVKPPNHDDLIDGETGSATKTLQTFHNSIAGKLNGIAGVAAPAAGTPVDLPTALTAITELQTIITALRTAANK